MTRAFAYNPSGFPISGVDLYGTLAVQNLDLDYSSKPGGIDWWMGPDEDGGYVIAGTVPSGDYPTPLGNVGTVQFWKTATLDNTEFVSLAQNISGQSFANPLDAKTWLESNSYWTNYSAILPALYYDVDVLASYPGSGSSIYNIGTGGSMDGGLNSISVFDWGFGGGAKSFAFDGISSFIQFNDYNFGDTFTVTGWFNPTSPQMDNNNIISNSGLNPASPGFRMGWNNYLSSDLAMNFSGGNGLSGNTSSTTSGVVPGGGWSMLTFVFNRLSPSIKFYRNASEYPTASGGSPLSGINTHNLNWYIGSVSGLSYFMSGFMGEIKVFNTLLDDTQILDEFNATAGRYLSN